MDKNLWPDFDVRQAPRSPKTVIEEAGSGLETKTNGVVRFWTLDTTLKDNIVELRFSLYTRSLGYHFPFLTARFPIAPLYPVTLVPDKMPEIVVNNEAELIAELTKIFNAPTIKDTVQRLMALATS